MAENLIVPKTTDRAEIYEALYPQVEALISGEPDLIANMANFAAVLKEAFGFFWVGFYLNKEDQLVLGPFQGPLACTRIPYSKGVCGHAFTTGETTIVPDVEAFPGHIACSSATKSEIVLPVLGENDQIIAVLDVDSDQLDDFSKVDQIGLEKLISVFKN